MKSTMLIDPVSLVGHSFEDTGAQLPGPNLGLVSLATWLRHHGYPCTIIDMAARKWTFDDVSQHVAAERPDIVGVTAKTFNITGAYRVARDVKQLNPDTVVVVGGSHPSALPEQTLEECAEIDAVCQGEGELTLLDVVKGKEPGQIKGLFYRDNGLITHGPGLELIPDIDVLPAPDFSLVDYSGYALRGNPRTKRLQPRYPIFHARGCPFNCTFCMSPRSYRKRSTERVLDEIERLHGERGTDFIFFEDSTFLPKPADFEHFCQAYMDRGLHQKVDWGFGTRIDVAYPEMFLLAKQAGCVMVFFGIESGNEHVLEKANKKYTRSRIKEIVTAAKGAGIDQVRSAFIIGLPYDTRETIEDTVTLIESLPVDGFGLLTLDIYPGTKLWDMADAGEGGLRWLPGKRGDWDSYSRSKVQVTIGGMDESELRALYKEALRRGWHAHGRKVSGGDGPPPRGGLAGLARGLKVRKNLGRLLRRLSPSD